MTDFIVGKVGRVIDGNTFEITVEERHKDNTDVYLDNEIIRLANFNSPALSKTGRKVSPQILRRKLWNKHVSLTVIGRDDDSRVIAYVNSAIM
ncbi:MAG: hypothetical protein QGH39_07800 [Candidatus Thermoplasmatota archaeon]|jgi:endonuclease YncB( thermonuclease family)|nr:hypothetical protein [Candidatus Thermoplasmatota archaeon]MDP7265448.1 hypothetical protein [Candidatus Thermoplasmatota archaeon]